MKNILRAFAFSLVATGAIASFHTSTIASPATSARLTAPPTPMCPPNDPNACGIDQVGR